MTQQPKPGHIPLDFEAAVAGLLAVDAKAIPKTAAAARKAEQAKKRAIKGSAKKKPAN